MRRTTLGPISSSQLNARSSVSSARVSIGPKAPVRQSIGPVGRPSIGAAQRRVSTAARLPPPAPAPRNSMSRQSVGSNAALSGRRSSVYGGRMSMAGRGARADPRPLADRTFMNSCIQALIEFLSERQYDYALSPKILKGPSKKDFCNIILFLFRQIDPTFEFGLKFEEDVAAQFKNLRYPFAISKTALVAVGSPHTWPALLGSIAWIIELLSYDEVVQNAVVDGFDSENSEKRFFEYLGNAYRAFLSGDDEQYNLMEQQEANKYDAQNQILREECDDLQRANAELRKRIEAAKVAKSSLPTLKAKKADLTSDLDKFKKLVSQLETHQTQLIGKIKEKEHERVRKEDELAERHNQIRNLQIRIDNQELSAEDVQQMSKERLRLNEQCQQVASRQKDIQNNIWRQETYIAEQMDKIESYVQQYAATATRMKLLPSMAKNAHGFDYDIEIDAHTGGVEAAQQLSVHLKQNIRAALIKFKKNRQDRTQVALDEVLQLQADVEKSREMMKMEYDEEQTMESKVRKLEDSIRREKEGREASISQKLSTTEDVELQIEAILNERDFATEENQSRKHHENLKKSFAAMTESYELLLEKSRHEITSALISCTDHKERIEHEIASLEQDVANFWL
ncbi:hypothetical protein Poli38472_002385 [Pythium oligandrum]|uniref:Kinetochore protein NDC80 n=1 Tax=Pythium oligandrum TaxID=41045 RepID=A0A8K1CH35_PYTOL|nr:hypothetical protein Poli38472_002385 [Pythium oligandrum]|eukprot:TMW63444.1 hypothetical protein Poli38472_002385 [Pythium oligandrum]